MWRRRQPATDEMGRKLENKDKNNFQNLADELKPREQMASLPSVTMMSSSSLLAIMLGHGVNGINVLELSNRLITAFGSATELAKADWRMIIERVRAYNAERPEAPIKGIGKVRAQTLCAAFEFVRRAYDAHDEGFRKKPLADADAAYDLFRRALPPNTRQEMFFVLPLDVKGCPLSLPIPVTKGVVDQAPVHAREILKHAISWGAKSIIVAHNHPSGDSTPSDEDIAVTTQLRAAAEIVSIPLKAHLVLGKERYHVL